MKQFETVPIKKPAVNVFNLSHDVKSSYNFDKLYPFFCHPINPGETFNVRTEVFLRAMPMLAPVMHNVDLYCYFFFVPYRLLWNENKKKDWRTFITGGEKGDFGAFGKDNTEYQDYVFPHFRYNQFADFGTSQKQLYADGSLLDHMGFASFSGAVSADRDEPFSSMPFRAYQCIYNEYFRNQNVQDEIEFSYGLGQETTANLIKLLTFRKKCFEKDYFTSCLPFQQRGEAVLLPISVTEGSGSAYLDVAIADLESDGDVYPLKVTQRNTSNVPNYANIGLSGSDVTDSGLTPGDEFTLKGTAQLTAEDLSFTGVSVGTIADFRYCLRLQQWLENNARCGSRYIEQILAHFGVTSSDARLQRPELLGGGKIPLIFSDIPQTSADTTVGSDVSVQGNLAGKGTLYGKTAGFKKYFEEHGILMGILTIIPRTSYSQGIPRYWAAMDKTDFYFPEFAHLSEQAVLNHELYYDPTADNNQDESLNPTGVFGYQGRYVEYRYIPSSVHGEMKNDLQYWHFGRLFPALPRLNANFVEAKTRSNVFAIADIANGDYDPFVAQLHLDVKAVRPMPKFAVPSL